MSNMIAIFGRANDIDDQGDMVPIPDAKAYFYVSGSTTPLVVYAEATLVTPLGTFVEADADGIFPRCYTSESTVKIDVIDGNGVSLDGFPQDEFPALPDSSSQAGDISAVPVTGNSGTTVQAQLDNNTARLNRLANATGLPVSSGSAGAYSIVAPYTITAYAARDEFEFIANHANFGGGVDSLSVDGVGSVTLKKYSGSTTKSDLAVGDIQIGSVVRVKYDGTNFVVVAATVRVLDEDDMATNSAIFPPSQQSVKAYVDNKRFTSSAQVIANGALLTLAHGLGEIPTFIRWRIRCLTAEAGYAINDEVYVDLNNSTNTVNIHNSCYADATNIYVRFSDNAGSFVVGNKSTGVSGGLTNANWNLIVEAMI